MINHYYGQYKEDADERKFFRGAHPRTTESKPERPGFIRVDNIEKRHFKFIYSSPINRRNIYLLLDVLFEDAKYTDLVSRQIKSELLITEGEMMEVQIPSVECVLGDKLTAFAPHTTGIRLNDNKDMEIAKQFYDVLTLTDIARDFEEVRDTYFKLVQDEIAYRGIEIIGEDALMDTYMTAACIASRGKMDC